MTIDDRRAGAGAVATTLIERAAAEVKRDCLRDPDASREHLRARVIDKLGDRSRLAEIVDLRALAFASCPGSIASAMTLRSLGAANPAVVLQLYALSNAEGPTPCQLLGWALTVLGPDWFYGAYVLDTDDEGLQSIVVYLNYRAQPVIPVHSIRENCEPVAHLLA